MSPSPTRELHHRWKIASPRVGKSCGDRNPCQDLDGVAVRVRDRRVDDLPDDKRRHECKQSGSENRKQEERDRSAVRASELPHSRVGAVGEFDPVERIFVTGHHVVWSHPHGCNATTCPAVRCMAMRRVVPAVIGWALLVGACTASDAAPAPKTREITSGPSDHHDDRDATDNCGGGRHVAAQHVAA